MLPVLSNIRQKFRLHVIIEVYHIKHEQCRCFLIDIQYKSIVISARYSQIDIASQRIITARTRTKQSDGRNAVLLCEFCDLTDLRVAQTVHKLPFLLLFTDFIAYLILNCKK